MQQCKIIESSLSPIHKYKALNLKTPKTLKNKTRYERAFIKTLSKFYLNSQSLGKIFKLKILLFLREYLTFYEVALQLPKEVDRQQ